MSTYKKAQEDLLGVVSLNTYLSIKLSEYIAGLSEFSSREDNRLAYYDENDEWYAELERHSGRIREYFSDNLRRFLGEISSTHLYFSGNKKAYTLGINNYFTIDSINTRDLNINIINPQYMNSVDDGFIPENLREASKEYPNILTYPWLVDISVLYIDCIGHYVSFNPKTGEQSISAPMKLNNRNGASDIFLGEIQQQNFLSVAKLKSLINENTETKKQIQVQLDTVNHKIAKHKYIVEFMEKHKITNDSIDNIKTKLILGVINDKQISEEDKNTEITEIIALTI